METSLELWGVPVWAVALIFARLGAALMLLPGFGETMVPARVRLGFALAFAICVAPALAGLVPAMPTDVWALAGLIIGEVLIGLVIGGCARLLMGALATAGAIMGLESGLSFAQTSDPTFAGSGQIFAVFLGLMGATLVFSTDLHHEFLRGLVGSYDVFSLGAATPVEDAAALAVDMVSSSFRVAFQIAAPLIVAGIVFRLGLGALARLIPTIQVFFVIIPLQLLGSFVIIAIGLSTGMLVWLDSLSDYARSLR